MTTQDLSAAERYEPTDEERKAFAKEALVIAWKTLQPLQTGDPTMAECMKHILQAHKDVHDFHQACCQKLVAAHPGYRYGYAFDTQHVIASAFALIDHPDIHQAHPYSQGGLVMMAFVKASTALAFLAEARNALDEDLEPFGIERSGMAIEILDAMS